MRNARRLTEISFGNGEINVQVAVLPAKNYFSLCFPSLICCREVIIRLPFLFLFSLFIPHSLSFLLHLIRRSLRSSPSSANPFEFFNEERNKILLQEKRRKFTRRSVKRERSVPQGYLFAFVSTKEICFNQD